MNIQQYIFQLKSIEEKFNKQLFAEISGKGRAVENLTARIIKRVRDTGKTADGSDFKPYSAKPMLVGGSSFIQKSAANTFFKEKNDPSNWRTVDGKHLKIMVGGYKELRQRQGREVSHKNFEYTTQMWKDFGVKSKTFTSESMDFIQKGDHEQYKLNYNSEREKKSIIQPSEGELELFRKEVSEQVAKILTVK